MQTLLITLTNLIVRTLSLRVVVVVAMGVVATVTAVTIAVVAVVAVTMRGSKRELYP
jgi:hypothetical protein